MPDDYQIDVPPSFTALHVDARQRLTLPLDAFRARYELCEDLANHLTEHCRSFHVEIGVDEQEVLSRCHAGLCQADSVVSVTEAGWIVTRLAELLSWPLPDLNPTVDEDTP